MTCGKSKYCYLPSNISRWPHKWEALGIYNIFWRNFRIFFNSFPDLVYEKKKFKTLHDKCVALTRLKQKKKKTCVELWSWCPTCMWGPTIGSTYLIVEDCLRNWSMHVGFTNWLDQFTWVHSSIINSFAFGTKITQLVHLLSPVGKRLKKKVHHGLPISTRLYCHQLWQSFVWSLAMSRTIITCLGES